MRNSFGAMDQIETGQGEPRRKRQLVRDCVEWVGGVGTPRIGRGMGCYWKGKGKRKEPSEVYERGRGLAGTKIRIGRVERCG